MPLAFRYNPASWRVYPICPRRSSGRVDLRRSVGCFFGGDALDGDMLMPGVTALRERGVVVLVREVGVGLQRGVCDA